MFFSECIQLLDCCVSLYLHSCCIRSPILHEQSQYNEFVKCKFYVTFLLLFYDPVDFYFFFNRSCRLHLSYFVLLTDCKIIWFLCCIFKTAVIDF